MIRLIVHERQGQKRILDAPRGSVLRDCLRHEGMTPYRSLFQKFNCGGNGICGSCTVRVMENGQWWERRSCQIRLFNDTETALQ